MALQPEGTDSQAIASPRPEETGEGVVPGTRRREGDCTMLGDQ
jgi:hypothetical protein